MSALPKVKDDSITFPLVIAEWDRNSREVIRVALDRYNGHHTVNARVWYRDRDDDMLRPGKAGIALGLKHLPALSDAMAKALARARQLGLLDEVDTRDNINSQNGSAR